MSRETPGAGKSPGSAKLPWALAGILLSLLAYLLFWPVAAEPAAWRPPAAPELSGPFERNTRLDPVRRVELGGARGPEDVAVDDLGRLYTGTEDGRILRLDPRAEGAVPRVFARTGGRPMGLAFDGDGRLLVADLERGLLAVSPEGEVRVLAAAAGGVPLGRTNGVAPGPDGTIYFTDASHAHPRGPAFVPLVEHRPTGRLLAHEPAKGRTRVLLDSLRFPNGVAVSPRGRFLLVSETGAYRVRRLELAGPRGGEDRILVSNLPGFPDGLSADPEGHFWLALAARRSAVLDALMPWPFLRKVLLRIPEIVRPGPRPYGFVLGLDGEGRTVRNLQGPGGSFAPVTSAVRVGDRLYLGSDVEDALGWVPVGPDEPGPETTAAPRIAARRTHPLTATVPRRPAGATLQAVPLDTADLGSGPWAEMRVRVEKTIFGVDVLDLRLRVDPATAAALEATARKRDLSPDLADTLARRVFRARGAWATVEFHRGFDRERMIEGIRRNLGGAVDAGMIDPSAFDAMSDSLPRWLHFLEDRGVRRGDTLHFRLRGDTVRVLFREAAGRVLADEEQVSGIRRDAVLARYLAPGSDFRPGLFRSLPSP